MSETKYTQGKIVFHKWMVCEDTREEIEKAGMVPARAMLNDGSVPLVIGEQPIAYVCRMKDRPDVEDPERDANAERLKLAWNNLDAFESLLRVCRQVADYLERKADQSRIAARITTCPTIKEANEDNARSYLSVAREVREVLKLAKEE